MKLPAKFGVALLSVLLLATAAHAEPVSQLHPTGYVNDFAHVLEQKARLIDSCSSEPLANRCEVLLLMGQRRRVASCRTPRSIPRPGVPTSCLLTIHLELRNPKTPKHSADDFKTLRRLAVLIGAVRKWRAYRMIRARAAVHDIHQKVLCRSWKNGGSLECVFACRACECPDCPASQPFRTRRRRGRGWSGPRSRAC